VNTSTQSTWDLYSWFAKAPIRPELGFRQLAVGLALLALLLGYSFYTDIHGRVIKNHVTVPLILAGLAAAPLLYPHTGRALLIGVGTALVLFLFSLTGGFGLGDAKLLTALAFLFGKAVLAVFFLAGGVALLYSLPVAILAARQKRQGNFEGKIRKIALPFGPAICLTAAVPVAVSGGGWWALAFLGLEGVTLAFLESRRRWPGVPAEAAPKVVAEVAAEETTPVEVSVEVPVADAPAAPTS
jgi:Flp pilus assembly protein protease CpaA